MDYLWFVLCIVQELAEEGKNAIEYPTSPLIPDLGPEFYQLGELRSSFSEVVSFLLRYCLLSFLRA